MAAINDLISQIKDETLRNRIQEEVSKMAKQKKFGLVFEEHMPESTPLYDMPIKSGCNVMRRDSKDDKSIYVVLKVEDDTAVCVKPEQKDETVTFELKDIVRVAEFGEPIYPYLKPLDSVCNAPDSDLWHTLIEADNYHALQLLEYLYAGKVDCIYIDPPYNTGAKDWKYNNDYVDSNDQYRHSKWLSMMQKRLKLSKKLLNPKESVLIVTIDEKEYLHLGCLLEEVFPNARIQMISDAINPKGVARSGFRRNDEYVFFLMIGEAVPARIPLSSEWSTSATISSEKISTPRSVIPGWTSMMRRGSHSSRKERPGLYYPIYVADKTKTIEIIGESLPSNRHRADEIDGLIQVLPIRSNGDEGCWQVGPDELRNRINQGRVRLGRETSYGYVINYLPDGAYDELQTNNWSIDGRNNDGSIIAHYVGDNFNSEMIAPTQWKISTHNASENGSSLIQKILCSKRFAFPKSLYSEADAIRFFVADKPDAFILDFFAGSGTTLHAVNLLNAEDGGHRRCIIVTNNEVSVEEEKTLASQGYQPGDAEWEKLGIAHYVTWPRTVCSIKGQDVNGNPLKGDYLGSEPPMHMADGFKANAAFFKLGFLDPTAVSLGMRISEMLPTLWLKTGAKGKCPELIGEQVPDMLILPENQFAVLINENTFADFAEKLAEHPEIQTVFLATDYEVNYQSMVKNLNVENAYQLYRDYLDHFRVNRGRN